MPSDAPVVEFPIVHCVVCAADVLGYLDLDDAEREVTRCLTCATVAAPDAVRYGDLHAIEELGFGLVLPEAGCGRPDCGRGRCGRS